MKALVTGGTGFIGAHVVRALLARGAAVRCLVRASSRIDNLSGLDIELARGDLCAPESLEGAIRGVDVVFHCAADYRLYARDPAALYAVNVEGTRSLLALADKHGIERFVYTSSVGALGLENDGTPADERTPVRRRDLVGHYKRSKFDAEQVAFAWANRGFPVILVNPSTPVGELDIKPTPTGRLIVDFLDGKLPAYVDTGLNLIDVRDVAEGHLLAADHGKPGERYILGHRNVELRRLLEMLSSLTGRPAPKLKLPHWVPIGFAALDTASARLLGREPRVALDAARLSRKRMYFDASKAVRELGLPQSPIEDALRRAVGWFRENGYVQHDAVLS
jgi:dihydroflavonol-4-reductase